MKNLLLILVMLITGITYAQCGPQFEEACPEEVELAFGCRDFSELIIANQDAFNNAFNKNTASPSGRKAELQGLSRTVSGTVLGVDYYFRLGVNIPESNNGFQIDFYDLTTGELYEFLDQNGDPVNQTHYIGTNIGELSEPAYATWYNNVVTRVRDLILDLILKA